MTKLLGLFVVAMVAFSPPLATAQVAEPSLNVAPSTDLVHRQIVEVSGSGFLPNTTVYVLSCIATATDLSGCDFSTVSTALADSNGDFSNAYSVSRFVQVGAADLDCSVDSCTIGAGDIGLIRTASAAVSFRNLPPPTISVSPATELTNGQAVQVTGSDFTPNSLVYLRQCSPTDCNSSRVSTVAFPDSRGGFTIDYQVARDIEMLSGDVWTLVDCAVETCRISAAGNDLRTRVFAAIGLADQPHPEPTFTVTLRSGDAFGVADLEGSGLPIGATLSAILCGPNVPADCGGSYSLVDVGSDGSFGSFSTVNISRINRTVNYNGDEYDCLIDECTVLLQTYREPRLTLAQSAPIVFPIPRLTTTVAPYGTLEAGTNDAVAQLEVSCDHTTPVSLQGTVSQTGISGGFRPENLVCFGGTPFQVFIPTREFTQQSTNFALGQASVGVAISPYKSLDAGPVTFASGSTDLLDYETLQEGIDVLLAEPANQTLREAVKRAIRNRVSQDPVFRESYFALFAVAAQGAGRT